MRFAGTTDDLILVSRTLEKLGDVLGCVCAYIILFAESYA